MNDAVKPLTVKAKLALSRAELLAAMGYEEVHGAMGGTASVVELPRLEASSGASALAARAGRSVLGRWWHRHPLHGVVQLGQPLLERYARRHPGRLVAYGAGTGALIWVLKPWRLLSVATVVTLLFKSSDLSGMMSGVVTKMTGVAEGELASVPVDRRPDAGLPP